MEDVIIIGAGPCGLSTAIELKKTGYNPLILEKGCIANSIYHFPLGMTFFSSPDKIEIGDVPFPTVHEKPTRQEGLTYYRRLSEHFQLRIHPYQPVDCIKVSPQHFEVWTTYRGKKQIFHSKNLVVSTGYYGKANLLNIPGEGLPHVNHYFREAHPYAGRNVVVIGGKNSAVDIALELSYVRAKVTMVYRKSTFQSSVKAWVKPLIESAIASGKVKMFWQTEVDEITEDEVLVHQQGEKFQIPAEFVFAMTGYRPDVTLLQRAGVQFHPQSTVPIFSESMETTVPNLYVAGVVICGDETSKVFIENGRLHGKKIAKAIKQREKIMD
nr:YpdA family putative bacillithiol disulfide reductase [Shimazuella kribbensis]